MSGIHADMATGAKGTAMARKTVGVIGLGLMGEVLAGRLMAAGFGVLGYDVDPAKKAKLVAMGGQAAAAPPGVAACATIALAPVKTHPVQEATRKGLAPHSRP